MNSANRPPDLQWDETSQRSPQHRLTTAQTLSSLRRTGLSGRVPLLTTPPSTSSLVPLKGVWLLYICADEG